MALQPRRSALGIFPQFIAQHNEELVLKEKLFSLSGDSFSITTVDGREIVRVKGEAFSLSGRKHIMDLQDNTVFDIRKEHFTIHTTYYIQNAQEEKLMEIKSRFSIAGSKATITFNNALDGGRPVELTMKGDFFARHADIIEEGSGEPIAQIRRKGLNARNLIGGQQTYIVAVAAGVDLSLVVAMCVCFDEKNNESES
ncbi:DUF567-domain-containing protein [Rhizodiscina lignyota]|uniref:DUF567-domain-containing protein n=1 Tax=Rhizodiscina lignyota TaxID=1504668 RepID=A0A9P4MBI4_9PEZI|nr:DUF567-domain-containing protein [Rhizodiscina lignyota]